MSERDDDERAFVTSTTALSPASGDHGRVVVAGRTLTSRPGYLRTIGLTFGSIATVPIGLLLFGAGFFPGAIATMFSLGFILKAIRRNAALFLPLVTIQLPREPFRIPGDDDIVVSVADGGAGKLARLVVTAKVVVHDARASEDDDGAIFDGPVLTVDAPERGASWRISTRKDFGGAAVNGRRGRCMLEARLYVPWFPDAVIELGANVE